MIQTAVRGLPIKAGWPTRLVADKAGNLTFELGSGAMQPERVAAVRFFPLSEGVLDDGASQNVTWYRDGLKLDLVRDAEAAQTPDRIEGVLVVEEALGAERVRQGFQLSVVSSSAPVELGPALEAQSSFDLVALLQAMGLAVLGGILLNLMPCVFPVLSLKALALAKKADAERAERRRQSTAYGVGVLTTFAALGVLLLGLRAAGAALGWGFQFQSPIFVLLLASLFFVLGLSMSGVFSLGGSIVGAGSGLTQREGTAGSFFTGVLASIASTPCTAPFMGAAIGYALFRPATEALLVVLALGVGFALPLVALGFSDRLARLLPRPGAWMETLKQALAFPLYASAGWLVWVLSLQSGSNGVLAAAIALVALGFAAWLFGRRPDLGLVRGATVAAVGLAGPVDRRVLRRSGR